mmetsp:Transcript_38534/g.96989  ORF Transcript_38534/g.96989 Transcript_38534/m.96989 type:complete len:205 (+) Transcript_38534:107-721(+)
MKKVSWASRAGCCCGWKRVSKFQKELSIYLFVGISSKPISRKISRNWDLTFIKGWRAPMAGGIPMEFRLIFLKLSDFQPSPCNISAVSCVCCFLMLNAYSGPFVILKVFNFSGLIKFLLERLCASCFDGIFPFLTSTNVLKVASSMILTILVIFFVFPSIASHLDCLQTPKPIFQQVSSGSLSFSSWNDSPTPSSGMQLKQRAS